ncbi:MAG: patatin-like phospholipase family protein [Pseudomonadota bacterium]
MRLSDDMIAGAQRAPVSVAPAPTAPRPSPAAHQIGMIGVMGGVFQARNAEAEARPRTAPAPIDVALFSAGGQWGAFSAGFMNGWSKNTVTRRPEAFDVVTGVSTGGLIAPFVFAGAEYDDELRDVYFGVDDRDVFRERSTLEIASSTSIWDPAPLARTIDGHLTDELVSGIAEAADRRSLLVGAVSLQSGFFDVFDLTAIAASDNPERETCMREGLMASAAIPVAFPPRRIDDTLYVDGGTREGIFLRGLAEANVRPTIYIFLNQTSGFPAENPDFTLADVVGRASSIATDELLRSAAIETLLFAKSEGWRVRGVLVPELWPGPECDQRNGEKATFCPGFTRALYVAGFAKGSEEPIRWMDADALIEALRQEAPAFREDS